MIDMVFDVLAEGRLWGGKGIHICENPLILCHRYTITFDEGLHATIANRDQLDRPACKISKNSHRVPVLDEHSTALLFVDCVF